MDGGKGGGRVYFSKASGLVGKPPEVVEERFGGGRKFFIGWAEVGEAPN